jgi:LPXTG-motif cell wall-anchored protein
MEISEKIEITDDEKNNLTFLWIGVGLLLLLFLIFGFKNINWNNSNGEKSRNDFSYDLNLEPGQEYFVKTYRKDLYYSGYDHPECFEIKINGKWNSITEDRIHVVKYRTGFRRKKSCKHSKGLLTVWRKY